MSAFLDLPVIFLGPSLSLQQARMILSAAEYQPPAAMGDVARAVAAGAKRILIIDGYFETVPAVFHKEILAALASGVAIFGASSMGALRAAELASFGMIGIGAIFHAYHSGQLTDDDEVALIHGPAELGYPAMSEALVNIRATLAAALKDGAISQIAARTVLTKAKAMPYRQRSYAAVRQEMQGLGDFWCWLDDRGAVDQKALDAQLALSQLNQQKPEVDFYFQHTVYYQRLLTEIVP